MSSIYCLGNQAMENRKPQFHFDRPRQTPDFHWSFSLTYRKLKWQVLLRYVTIALFTEHLSNGSESLITLQNENQADDTGRSYHDKPATPTQVRQIPYAKNHKGMGLWKIPAEKQIPKKRKGVDEKHVDRALRMEYEGCRREIR